MNSAKTANYLLLEKLLGQIDHLGNLLNIINWDYSTYMPSGSASSRQEEITTLSSIIHKMLTAKETGDLIAKAEQELSFLTKWQKANLRESKRNFLHSSCISDNLQERYTKASSQCEFIWREARKQNDFNLLKPYLQNVIDITKEIATVKSEHLNLSKYDSLIDMYDPGRKCASIKPVYDKLKLQLPELIRKIIEKQSKETVLPLTDKINIEQQKAIGKRVMEVMGFDFNKGRLDVSAHPFCGGTHNDLRLTARYDENNFLSGLWAIIHETGHGLYELYLPNEYKNQPVGNAKGMAFHESQSLVMEMQAARTQEFIEFLAKLLRDEFAFIGQEYSSDNLYKLATRVNPSFIRVDADEVTYPLHVILRFEIEHQLIEGSLTVDDLTECWNLKMQEYLGIKPSSYSEGCLQDIHWPSGSFGYFPAYTNGAIIASMLMKKAKEENSNILSALKEGNFSDLNLFLNTNLRSLGSLHETTELLQISTGYTEVQPEIFINYLSQKYLQI